MDIKILWKNYKFPSCDNCKKDCNGRLNYNNLCSNINYLKEYGEKNYIKNKESLIELKNILGDKIPTIFSFGCGLGFDYIAAKDIFGENVKYFGIDNCNWAIKNTENYLNFESKLPKTITFDVGKFLLYANFENLVICFFNSLFTISDNTDLEGELIKVLQSKNDFYIICDFTINNNLHMRTEEISFLSCLTKKLNNKFKFKQFDILDGRGIIILGKRK